MAKTVVFLGLLLLGVATAVKLTTDTVTFGHSVKNGVLPPTDAGELTTFEHNCTTAPCMITQIHCPSIYPKNTADWDWQNGVLRFYVDGEQNASIEVKLLELAWVSEYASPSHASLRPGSSGGQYDNRGLPWIVPQFGHTASSGGVSSTLRIPFGKSIRVTIQAPPNTATTSVYWLIVRGVENGAIELGEFELPPTARMHVYRVNVTLDHLDLVTLASAPASVSGAIIGTKFDAVGSNDGYLEACMRLYPTAAATSPIFLSSGAEDYFLSASYFDEGGFVSPNAGLTFKDTGGGIGSYKMHDWRDPVVWHNGFKLQFRSGESTSGCGSEQLCPNQFCPPGAAEKVPNQSTLEEVGVLLQNRQDELKSRKRGSVGATNTASVSDACVPGPIAYGFDRPGGDGEIGPMTAKNGSRCSGVGMLNASGCSPVDCAAQCCGIPDCTAWVHGIAPGCDKNHDDSVCCWTKHESTQIVVDQENYLTTGEVAGHGGAPAPPQPGPPGPGPSPKPSPWIPPPAPVPADGKTVYHTLVYTYEWPSSATPTSRDVAAGSLETKLKELSLLRAKGTISETEYVAARKAALGI